MLLLFGGWSWYDAKRVQSKRWAGRGGLLRARVRPTIPKQTAAPHACECVRRPRRGQDYMIPRPQGQPVQEPVRTDAGFTVAQLRKVNRSGQVSQYGVASTHLKEDSCASPSLCSHVAPHGNSGIGG